MTLRICCVAPNIFGFTGGIQAYTWNFLTALKTLLPKANYTALLKYDRDRDITYRLVGAQEINFVCFGCWPRQIQTLAMTAMLLWLAFRHPDTWFVATHANYAKALYIAKQLFGIKYWVIAHGIEVWQIRDRSLIQALQAADKIIAVSYYTRDRLMQEQSLPAQQVAVLPNTFHTNRFSIRPKPAHLLAKFNLSTHQKIILTVCRLGKSGVYKGYEQIIQSLPLIRQQMPDIHYVLVGKGDDSLRIKQLIRSLNLEKHVTLAGFIPDVALSDYYNLCDVFAMPSMGEGFGIVYLEALACGKPVLAGNQDGAVDPLLNGQLGCLVNPCNHKEIASALIQILQGSYRNKNLYRPEFLRETVISHFSETRFRSQLASLLRVQYFGSCVL